MGWGQGMGPTGDYGGIDISNHQPPSKIDMPTVANNIDFMWHKASEGTGFTDRYWAARSGWARDNGLPIGAYHFARPDQHGWKAEADFFLTKIDGKETIPPCLDWEHQSGIRSLGKAGAAEWCVRFMSYVGDKLGVTPWFYTSYYIARDMMSNDPALGKFPLWEAWYATNDNHQANQARVDSGWLPPTPPQWAAVSMWQYSSAMRTLPGTSGVRIDTNVSYVQPWNADVTPPPRPPVVTPPPTQDNGPTPILKRGDKGEKVKTVQQLLSGAGFQVDADGDFGPATESAVQRYQKAHNLTVDGIVGPATWTALLAFLGGDAQPVLGEDYDGYLESIKTADGKIQVSGWGIDPKNVKEQPKFRLIVGDKTVKHFTGSDGGATTDRVIAAKPEYKGAANLGFNVTQAVDPGEHVVAVHIQKADGKYWNLWQSPQKGIKVPGPAPTPDPEPTPDPDPDPVAAIKAELDSIKALIAALAEKVDNL